jgi:hypothetical protein
MSEKPQDDELQDIEDADGEAPPRPPDILIMVAEDMKPFRTPDKN